MTHRHVRSRAHRPGAVIAGAVAAVVVAAVVVGSLPAAAEETAAPAQAAGSPVDRSVTLLTGDRVTLVESGGQASTRVDPGPGRAGTVFYQHRDAAGHIVVVPDDAQELLAAGRLDPRLFDVTDLVAQNYDDAHRQELPLLVSYAKGTPMPAAVVSAGAHVTRELRALGMSAIAEPRTRAGGVWKSLRGPGLSRKALAPGLSKVWLNARVRATLDQSVPQIGAPAVWQTGDRGQGVSVAVLDSGYDATHPDLVGAVAQSRGFTAAGVGDVADRLGHCTHVASIVAGRGTASGGRYVGAAPAATLIVGKVLDDYGYGTDDQILAGMQWAVEQKARVVNMSLGGGQTDGTDPLSTAVNQLTADTGTLFVISAGNSGADHTVGSPGAADAALTVGSVSKQDELSSFSSRGPRWGDDAVKPDVTAPGGGIVAARVVGTPAGDQDPVDSSYTRLSGTSMSAPHVAGAAALLAQAHPDWRADKLKAALMNTARPAPNQSVYAQGTGRIDVAAAFTQTASASVGSLSLGRFNWPLAGQPSVTKQVSYRNEGATPASLVLAADLTDAGGTAAPAGMLTVTPATLTVPAHGSATATVVLSPAAGRPGLFGGTLSAAVSGGAKVRVALGTSLEAENFYLTVQTIGRDGLPAPRTFLSVVDQSNPFSVQYPFFDNNGRAVVRVPKGTYTVSGFLGTTAVDGSATSATAVAQPDIQVNADATVTLDGRGAKPVDVRLTGEPTARQLARNDHITVKVAGTIVDTSISSEGDLPYFSTGVTGPSIGYATYVTWARPQVRLTVTAPEAFEPLVEYADYSVRTSGEHTYNVVDGGLGRPEDLSHVDVRGKVVLLRFNDEVDITANLGAVAQAGAVAAIYPRGNIFGLPFSEPTPVPAITTSRTAFDRVAALAQHGAVSVNLLGYPSASPYVYNLVKTEQGRLPEGASYQVKRSGLAAVDTRYRALGQPGSGISFAFPKGMLATAPAVPVDLPMRRVEYFTPGRWSAGVSDVSGDIFQRSESAVDYQAGRAYRSEWHAAVIGPKIVAFADRSGVVQPGARRSGDTIDALIEPYSDSTAGRIGFAQSFYDTGTLTLRRDGHQIGEASGVNAGTWAVPAQGGLYTMTLEADRPAPNWYLSTSLRTTWTFHSGHVDAGTSALPVLLVGYDLPLDASNTMAARGGAPLVISVARQAGAGTATIRNVQVSTSHDDGVTWQALKVGTAIGKWYAAPLAGSPGTYISLRVKAVDTEGNAIEQSVIRAYRLH